MPDLLSAAQLLSAQLPPQLQALVAAAGLATACVIDAGQVRAPSASVDATEAASDVTRPAPRASLLQPPFRSEG